MIGESINLFEPISDIDVLVNSVTNVGIYPSATHTIWAIFAKQVMEWQMSIQYVAYIEKVVVKKPTGPVFC